MVTSRRIKPAHLENWNVRLSCNLARKDGFEPPPCPLDNSTPEILPQSHQDPTIWTQGVINKQNSCLLLAYLVLCLGKIRISFLRILGIEPSNSLSEPACNPHRGGVCFQYSKKDINPKAFTSLSAIFSYLCWLSEHPLRSAPSHFPVLRRAVSTSFPI